MILRLIITSGATHGINIVSSGLEFKLVVNELIVSEMEHHSNIVHGK